MKTPRDISGAELAKALGKLGYAITPVFMRVWRVLLKTRESRKPLQVLLCAPIFLGKTRELVLLIRCF